MTKISGRGLASFRSRLAPAGATTRPVLRGGIATPSSRPARRRLREILQRELTARGIAFLTITGQTEIRQDLVDEFQASPDVGVFLLSLKAADSGLNLTAASYVVLFDPWWNPAVEAQAIDRTHRIGQTNQVMAYRLIAKDTVEEKIRLLQHEKSALARAVVQEESLASVMNLDDLRYVLA